MADKQDRINYYLAEYRLTFNLAKRGLDSLSGKRDLLQAALLIPSQCGQAMKISALVLRGIIVEDAANG